MDPKSPEDAQTPTSTPESAPADSPLREPVIEAMRTVFDPEIPINIYELGLIYDVGIDDELGKVHVKMTLTSPACPVAGTLPGDVEVRVKEVEGVEDCSVELVWEPPWDKDRLSEEAKLQLGLL